MGSPFRLGRFWAGAATLALAVALGGCAVGPQPGTGSPAPAVHQALDVRLPGGFMLDQGPWAVFHLSQPAYVAIFDIRPGVGVTALHPNDYGPVHQRRFGAGMQTVLRSTWLSGRRGFALGFGGASWYGLGHGARHGTCLGSMYSPVVWRLIVASERPLRLDRLHSHVAFRLRPAFGARHFAGGSVRSTMDDILRLVLPPGAIGFGDASRNGVRWAADYQSYWIDAPRCTTPSRFALAPLPVGAHPGAPVPPGAGTPPDTAETERPGIADAGNGRLPLPTWGPEEGRDGESARDGAREDRESLLPTPDNPRSFSELRLRAGQRAAAARQRADRTPGAASPRRDRTRSVTPWWRDGPDRTRLGGARPNRWGDLRPPRRQPAAERPATTPQSRRPAVRSTPPRSTRPPAVRRPAPRSSDSGSRKESK